MSCLLQFCIIGICRVACGLTVFVGYCRREVKSLKSLDSVQYIFYHGLWDHDGFYDLQTDPLERLDQRKNKR